MILLVTFVPFVWFIPRDAFDTFVYSQIEAGNSMPQKTSEGNEQDRSHGSTVCEQATMYFP